MSRNRHFVPTAGSSLPNHIRKDSDDSSKTYQEIVGTYGFPNQGEADVFLPLVKPKPQPTPIYRGDDNLTLGEAMKKGVVPQGMRPTWSPEARKKYRECIEPDVTKYEKAVDKINRRAEDTLNGQKRAFYANTLNIGTGAEILKAASSDAPFRIKWSISTTAKSGIYTGTRVVFWGVFGLYTYNFFVDREVSTRAEAEDFVEATENFLEKVNECREKNPYDVWTQLTSTELRPNMFLESFRPTRPHYGILYPITNPER